MNPAKLRRSRDVSEPYRVKIKNAFPISNLAMLNMAFCVGFAGGTAVLSRSDASQIVDFYYPYGAGFVYYSTMPLDYYLGGNGPNPPQGNFVNIYAPNEASFQASLSQGVPEPATMTLFGTGLVILGAMRRRRGKIAPASIWSRSYLPALLNGHNRAKLPVSNSRGREPMPK